VIFVIDTSADMTEILRRIAASSGTSPAAVRAVPGRHRAQEESLARMLRRTEIGSREQELALLDDLAR